MMWRSFAKLAGLGLLSVAASAAITIDPGPIPELKPPRESPIPPAAEQQKTDVLPWFLGAGAIAIISAVVASWPKKLPPAPPPPYTIARRELDLLNPNAVSPATVASIVRSYLLNAFHIPARGATPEEIVELLASHSRWDVSVADEVSAFFATHDTVKFSPSPPLGQPTAVEAAKSLIARIEGRRASGVQPATEVQAQ
jgi:hypothetical protein